MLKLLVVGLPMLCQPASPDLIAGWKSDDNGKVCFCQQSLACDSLLLIADNTVRSGNRNIGSDPDANVRFQMMRDDNSRYGGAD
jgi:hypothetical protein